MKQYNPALQGILRTVFHTFHAENALGSVFPFSGIIRHVHVHRADAPAPAAGDAFIPVTFYPHHGKIAHWFQEHRNRTDILAESTIVFQQNCEDNANHIIEDVACNKEHEHRVVVCFSEPE